MRTRHINNDENINIIQPYLLRTYQFNSKQRIPEIFKLGSHEMYQWSVLETNICVDFIFKSKLKRSIIGNFDECRDCSKYSFIIIQKRKILTLLPYYVYLRQYRTEQKHSIIFISSNKMVLNLSYVFRKQPSTFAYPAESCMCNSHLKFLKLLCTIHLDTVASENCIKRKLYSKITYQSTIFKTLECLSFFKKPIFESFVKKSIDICEVCFLCNFKTPIRSDIFINNALSLTSFYKLKFPKHFFQIGIPEIKKQYNININLPINIFIFII